MGEKNPSSVPKKNHTALIIIIVLCVILFVGIAKIMVSPMLGGFLWHAITGGDLSKISDSLSAIKDAGLVTDAQPSENYLIKQKTSMPFSISAPYGVMDGKSVTDFIIVGQPASKARSGYYGWQTDWKLIINSTLLTSTKTEIKTSLGHTSAVTANFTPDTNQYVYYFSLAGLKEGDAFTMKYTVKKLAESTFHFNEKNWNFYDKDNQLVHIIPVDPSEYKTDLPVSEKVQEINAFLVKNNGNDGAVIAFAPAELTPAQKKELDRAKSAINQSWWNTQIYDTLTSPPQFPPLNIITKGNLPEKGYLEEVLEDANSSKNKPDSKNNNSNKVPNLAPLPSSVDKNGDGIPDLVPLPGSKQ